MLLVWCMSSNKAEDTLPCISRGHRNVGCSAVKYAMRRAWVDHDLVPHTALLERVIACCQASCTPKIIHCYRRYAGLSEAQGQFFVELVQATHIGIDEHLRTAWLVGMRNIGSKTIAICCGQYDVFTMSCAVLS